MPDRLLNRFSVCDETILPTLGLAGRRFARTGRMFPPPICRPTVARSLLLSPSRGYAIPDEYRNDLRGRDGDSWSQLPVTGPSTRTLGAMVFDQARRRLVMFSGYDADPTTPLGDTWEYLPPSSDCNQNGILDERETNDVDSDGVIDDCDTCPLSGNPEEADYDADTVGDASDNCLLAANPDLADSVADGVGDACGNCPAIPK